MPKMKTCKSARKRYIFTSRGKVKHKKQNLRHILTKKSAKRRRNLGKSGLVSISEIKRIKTLLPYA
ncbi:50S ribosomal protein L35 [Borrelia miyamotoi]|uniref:Large ribosomal subunit protein bL35 n=1 Tax=Borrelia miyamotoi TaxID=47466 RepID=A0AAQ2WX18_9SPIR|nr:50S ribosomal protein L35 [Borrelia miyamotoi]AGT27184.1 50S ribosomal protein L35 [Borrelia miyamotoi LB-2001]AJA58376.1 50S ribosomal protein L35 [Borrelia miyamotoi]AOW95453.1 50S ribosomal protein L35 [Borrelia miyamotoi]ASQ28999.1 50S ribosomal protein L35 [Borrelia miyamotoi]QTL83337.1 50S ribosomal protein L35 [Borrelia miyamotoi]